MLDLGRRHVVETHVPYSAAEMLCLCTVSVGRSSGRARAQGRQAGRQIAKTPQWLQADKRPGLFLGAKETGEWKAEWKDSGSCADCDAVLSTKMADGSGGKEVACPKEEGSNGRARRERESSSRQVTGQDDRSGKVGKAKSG